MANWWCSKCGEPGELKDGYAPMDPRFGLGSCTGSCRSEVQLSFGTRDEALTLITEREDKALRQKQMLGLRVSSIPDHPRYPKCCAREKVEHLSLARLQQLHALMGVPLVDTGISK